MQFLSQSVVVHTSFRRKKGQLSATRLSRLSKFWLFRFWFHRRENSKKFFGSTVQLIKRAWTVLLQLPPIDLMGFRNDNFAGSFDLHWGRRIASSMRHKRCLAWRIMNLLWLRRTTERSFKRVHIHALEDDFHQR